MKKKVLAVLAGMLCMGNVVMADLATDEGYLGGICPGTDTSYITEIFGTPDEETPAKYTEAWQEYTKHIKYGNSVSFYCTGKSVNGPFDVVMIHISANNGFATPRGIHVGSTHRQVLAAYGHPDINQLNGKHLWYNFRNGANMVFHFKGDIVESINLGWNA